jgi:hypothetical protein
MSFWIWANVFTFVTKVKKKKNEIRHPQKVIEKIVLQPASDEFCLL